MKNRLFTFLSLFLILNSFCIQSMKLNLKKTKKLIEKCKKFEKDIPMVQLENNRLKYEKNKLKNIRDKIIERSEEIRQKQEELRQRRERQQREISDAKWDACCWKLAVCSIFLIYGTCGLGYGIYKLGS